MRPRLLAASLLGSLLVSASDLSADEPQQASCGVPGRPACPLQSWMRQRVAAPLASNNGAALAVALERVASAKPDADWLTWEQYALEGAAAAKRGDLRAARAACTGCHGSFRELYRDKFRDRRISRERMEQRGDADGRARSSTAR
jgi:hypothetical protein